MRKLRLLPPLFPSHRLFLVSKPQRPTNPLNLTLQRPANPTTAIFILSLGQKFSYCNETQLSNAFLPIMDEPNMEKKQNSMETLNDDKNQIQRMTREANEQANDTTRIPEPTIPSLQPTTATTNTKISTQKCESCFFSV